ncbi:MAG: toxin-antitoxin system HicB family antitoxin [Thermomicrobiales bacterium]
MTATERRTLADYLAMEYPFNVIADPDAGGYVIEFPDLPGCLTQVDTLDELPAMVEEVRALWIETTYELGQDVPMPSYPEEYSGRFNVRIPRSLHRNLVESAERDGVSLNQYVLTLLAQRDAQARVEAKLDALLAAQSRQEQPARIAS